MTVSHAHARNACAHEQSTNIESGAVQWYKQSEQLLDCERKCEREKVCCIVIASRTYCHPELVEGSRGNETTLYKRHFTSFRYREIATLTLAMTTGFCDKTRAELANLCHTASGASQHQADNLRNCGMSIYPCMD